jgi:hypothetical protein
MKGESFPLKPPGSRLRRLDLAEQEARGYAAGLSRREVEESVTPRGVRGEAPGKSSIIKISKKSFRTKRSPGKILLPKVINCKI